MLDPLQPEAALVAALQLTARPPETWIDAAALIPSTLGDLEALERIVDSAEFRARFARDPCDAVVQAGLEPSESLLGALQARLGA